MPEYCEHVYVSGFVQNVGYRDFTRRAAVKHTLTGWCRNLADGRVEALLCGTQENVKHCIAEMQKGPQLARVLHIERLAVTDHTSSDEFEVKR